MSWHWVGPALESGIWALCAVDPRLRRCPAAPAAARRCPRAVGAPVPSRALTMLSSISAHPHRVDRPPPCRRSSRRIRPWPWPPPAPSASAAMSSGASPCFGGATRSLKIRGELTIAACSGCASGTLMTSMRNSAELGSFGHAARAAGQLAGRPDGGRARDVDVDVLRVLRIDQHRVGVGAAAGLHVAHVLRIGDVGDVEDPDAAEPLGADRVLHALGAAVEPAARFSPETKSRFL